MKSYYRAMLKKIELLCFLLVVICGLVFVFNASQTMVLSSSSSYGDSVHTRDGAYRELGGFSANRFAYRKWFQDNELWIVSGLVVQNAKIGTKVRIGSSRYVDGELGVVHTFGTIVPGARRGVYGPEYFITVDIDDDRVALSHTTHAHVYDPQSLYIVMVDADGQLLDFVKMSMDEVDTLGLDSRMMECLVDAYAHKEDNFTE